MPRDGLDGALEYLVQQIRRHLEAQQAQAHLELSAVSAAEVATVHSTVFLLERAEKRTADAYAKLDSAITLYNLEVVKTIEATIAAKEAPVT